MSLLRNLKDPSLSPEVGRIGRLFMATAGGFFLLFGLLVLLICAFGVLARFGPWWGHLIAAVVGMFIGSYGIDLLFRGLVRDIPGQSLFEGRIGTARAVAGFIVCGTITITVAACLTYSLLKGKELPEGGVYGGIFLFGAVAGKCGQVLWCKLHQQSAGQTSP